MLRPRHPSCQLLRLLVAAPFGGGRFPLASSLHRFPSGHGETCPAYSSSQDQTALVGGAGFTVVTFFGSITNNTILPIAFDTVGSGPVTPDPYVAGFVGAFAYPGIILGPGASVTNVALATVTLNPFDPSLTYPSTRLIKVEAVIPGTGTILGENDAMIQVVSSVPEPPTVLLFAGSLLGLVILSRKSRIATLGNSA